jgi:hypothetical protein
MHIFNYALPVGRSLILVITAVVLTACISSQQSFDERRSDVKADPKKQKEVVDRCVNGMAPSERKYLSEFLAMPEAEATPVFCKRMLAGLLAGRITFTDLRDFRTGGRIDPRIKQVALGK